MTSFRWIILLIRILDVNIPLLTIEAIFFLIAVRQIGNIKLQIWQIMLGGTVIVFAAGSISPAAALRSIQCYLDSI
jgi:hypothetical protein